MGDYPVCVVFSYVVPFAGQMRVLPQIMQVYADNSSNRKSCMFFI